jgi:hypothetical protein
MVASSNPNVGLNEGVFSAIKNPAPFFKEAGMKIINMLEPLWLLRIQLIEAFN